MDNTVIECPVRFLYFIRQMEEAYYDMHFLQMA